MDHSDDEETESNDGGGGGGDGGDNNDDDDDTMSIPSSPSYHELMDLLEHDDDDDDEQQHQQQQIEVEEEIINGLQMAMAIEYPLDSMEELHLNPHHGEPSDPNTSSDDGTDGGTNNNGAIPAAAREHTYLPGITSALFPEEWLIQGRPAPPAHVPVQARRQQYKNTEAATTTDVNVDFGIEPIATRSTIASHIVQIPILELEGVVTFPYSTLPLRFESREWIRYLKAQIDRVKSMSGGIGSTGSTTSSSFEESQVQIGILTKVKKRRRRRRGSEGEIVRGATGGRMGRWNLAMIRRGILRSTRRRGEDGSPVVHHHDDDDEVVDNDHPTSADEGSASSNTPTQFFYPTTRTSTQEPPVDPLIGRIGTFATITYIQERDDNMENEIIVTALSTGRFKIISLITQCDYQENARDTSSQCLIYNVEHLYDENVRLPVSLRQQKVSRQNQPSSSGGGRRRHDNDVISDLQKLSSVTGLPIFSYLITWPIKLVMDIVTEIIDNDAFRGLLKSMPSSSGLQVLETDDESSSNGSDKADISINKNQIDPQHFSFWLSSNLPLSEYDKLELLEMSYVEGRLKFILDYMRKQRQIVHYLRCKQCGAQIAQMTDIFTLEGAEGTTGAYVNEHGVIHQTITLRKIGNARCIGGAETKDSWFPGYAWTIAYCNLCASHLGWKFHLVNRRSESEPDRPVRFWGVSGSNVTTSTASPSLHHLHPGGTGAGSP